ncbi:MAG: D-alanyl-D-alanine carboxypeptidase [Clostridiales bacterium]|nr:D-alanyl-D-alanine carboxypeptidase [Clostridiales bacterium]
MKKLLALTLCCLLLVSACPPAGASADLSAQAAVLLEAGQSRVLTALNEHQRLPMASTTKIMTAIVALERVPLDRVGTVSARAAGAEGSTMYLQQGERYSLDELLYGLLMASGNDAAVAVAELASGSVERFVAHMNRKAAALGLENTHFDNPSGLDGDSHYTSAYDLALLMRYALQNEDFCRYIGTRGKVLPADEGRTAKYLTSKNKMLLHYPGALGGKTGYTKAAGRSLVTAARRDGVTLIAVTINDPDDWRDHTALLDEGFVRAVRAPVAHLYLSEYRLPVAGGGSLRVRPDATEGLVLVDADPEALTASVQLPPFTYAGVGLLEQVGQVVFFSGGQEVGRLPLRAYDSSLPDAQNRGRIGLLWQRIWYKLF